ncbi:hypothetical protein BGZ73_008530 [Actinomortierella ambigua]|nr:hypothetical protein BGZ73_008530 [Actinomortierella ambigua]
MPVETNSTEQFNTVHVPSNSAMLQNPNGANSVSMGAVSPDTPRKDPTGTHMNQYRRQYSSELPPQSPDFARSGAPSPSSGVSGAAVNAPSSPVAQLPDTQETKTPRELDTTNLMDKSQYKRCSEPNESPLSPALVKSPESCEPVAATHLHHENGLPLKAPPKSRKRERTAAATTTGATNKQTRPRWRTVRVRRKTPKPKCLGAVALSHIRQWVLSLPWHFEESPVPYLPVDQGYDHCLPTNDNNEGDFLDRS